MDEGPEWDRLRSALASHIAMHRPRMGRLPGTRSPDPQLLPEYKSWCGSLFEAGFFGADWPTEWGGCGRASSLRDLIVDDELAKAGTPRPVGAWNLVSRALLAFGTDEQKARFLPRIRRFDDLWCQLFSEPEAGSDLASVRTTARPRPEGGWVLQGQKVWTTQAHVADWGLLLARVNPAVEKHAGLGMFVLDMRSEGVSVRPLREITGSSDFNEVFLDDVVIASDALIGLPGDGWAIARDALSHERAQNQREDSVTDKVRRLIELAPSGPDGLMRDARALGRLMARSRASDLLGHANLLREEGGQARVFDAPVAKVFFTQLNLEIVTEALEQIGVEALLAKDDDQSVDDGYWLDAFLYARGYTIAGGSNEVMRNVIAERGLGLPKA